MVRAKKLVLVHIINDLKAGLNFSKIAKKYAIPKQTLNYYRGKLINLGYIQKKGYGTWEVIKEVPIIPKVGLRVQTDLLGLLPIKGHAFRWNITFQEAYNWPQILKNYKKRHSKLSFNLICNGKVIRTIFHNKKTWFTRNGLTIYEPLDFLGRSAPHSKGMAVYELDSFLNSLFKELSLKLGYYEFICSKEHFSYIKNLMAKQFNERKQKIYVSYNGRRFWIDHSEGQHEEESNNVITSIQAQKYYEDQLKTNFSVTPSFLLESLNSIKQSLEFVNNKFNSIEGLNSMPKKDLKDFKLDPSNPGYIA